MSFRWGPVRLATVHARQIIHNTGEQTVPSQEGGRKRPGNHHRSRLYTRTYTQGRGVVFALFGGGLAQYLQYGGDASTVREDSN